MENTFFAPNLLNSFWVNTGPPTIPRLPLPLCIFRSRTLGHDIYPEDHFLRNFPWQQFGGLDY